MSQSSEFGGDPGLIQPLAKGHLTGEAGADREAGQEEAMLMRMLGRREASGLGYDPRLGDNNPSRFPEDTAGMRRHLESGKAYHEE